MLKALMILSAIFCCAVPAVAQVSGEICGTVVTPQTALTSFTDAGATTRVWRQKVTACRVPLSVMFWQQDTHWMMTIERVVPNVLAPRASAIPVTAALRENGKTVARIDGMLHDFQIAYAENKPLVPRADPAKLRAARLVPPIAMLSPPKKPAYLTQAHYAVKPYTSLKDGPLDRGMPNSGERADIGVVHEWCAMWLNYPSDYWWKACVAAAKDQANIPWHVSHAGKPNLFLDPKLRRAGFDYRQPEGQRIALPEAPHDVLSFQNDPSANWIYKGEKRPWVLDGAHQPFALLVPYMATRHPYFLYLAQYQYGVQLGGLNVGAEWGGRLDYAQPTILIDQDRGIAWSFRTLTQTLLMTPSATPDWLSSKAQLKPILQASVARWSKSWTEKRNYWQLLQAGKAGKAIGEAYTIKATGKAAFAMQPWEQDYLGQSLGFARWAGISEVDPLYALTRDMLTARYGTGSPFRVLGAPFTVVFSNPQTGATARNLQDVVRFTPSENLAYGTNKPLTVGQNGNIGEWTNTSWHVQGALAYCALNGDARCTEPLNWWNRQASDKGTHEFDKYRVAVE
jgi:hypothetical protein